MLARGIAVSGSDGVDSPTLDALRDLGARIHLGHDAAQVHDVDTVVVSTAVREDNPEYVEAVRQGLRVLPRSAALAAVMAGRRVLAVAGTHGKTTTTSLLTVALQAAGADPTYAVGGDLAQTGRNAQEGSDDLFVAEADESDGAFLVYRPHAAIVTNVEADHLDNWGTEEAYRAAFTEFVGTLDPDGFLVYCADDEGARDLAGVARARGLAAVGVGERADADLRAADLRFEGTTSTFTVHEGEQVLGEITLQIPGRHYVLDALAALAVGLRLGFPFEGLKAGLEGFAGTRRRMERKGEAAGVRVYDSYAHHPVEIAGDLQAGRSVAGEGRLVVAFQPHLVSRTRIFGTAMGEALGAADEVVVLDVYLAREDADPEVTGALVAGAVPLPSERVAFVADFDAVATELVVRARPGDLVLTLGAGSVTQIGPQVLALLEERAGA
jgi:UDP-N-acetylmuramate--alanine ligase